MKFIKDNNLEPGDEILLEVSRVSKYSESDFFEFLQKEGVAVE